MLKKIIVLIALTLLANLLVKADESSTTSTKAFPEFRKKAAKLTPYSPEDYALGRELLKAIREFAKKRKPVFDRTMLFARTHYYHSGRLFNCKYYWYDRPLFASRMLWEPGKELNSLKPVSFKKTIELYKSYDLDGLATFFQSYRHTTKPLYEAVADLKLDPAKFHIMLSATPSVGAYRKIDDGTLRLILNNPYSFRLNGESVMASYLTDRKTPEAVAKYLKDLDARCGGKKIMLISQIYGGQLSKGWRGKKLSHPMNLYHKHKSVPATLLLHHIDYISKYLRVSGGVEIGDYYTNSSLKLDKDYYNEVALPLFGAAIAQEEFNGKKIFMNRFEVGYTSYHGAQSLSRDGTKSLRGLLDAGIKNRLDILLGTEWDELNEDTHIEPTVAKPMSSQRIIKYYASRLRKEPPTPNPGDDLSLPNMIISQRRQLTNGWMMDVELLNVPDTDKGEKYSVVLELLNENSKAVFKSKPVAFDTAKMKDHTFNLPSGQFAACQLLQPRLTINYRGKQRVISEGLPFTVMRTTTSRDHTYFCTPLRNVLFPIASEVDFKDTGKMLAPGVKELSLNTSLKFADELNTVELVQDSYEIYAYDPQDEWLQNDPDRRLYELSRFYLNTPDRIFIKLERSISNAPSAMTFVSHKDPINKKDENPTMKWKAVKAFSEQRSTPFQASDWTSHTLISIKKQDIDKAVLTVSGVRTRGPDKGKKFEWQIPLKELGDYGIKSKIFDDGLGFSLQTQYRPPKVPLPLNCTEVKFKTILAGDEPNGVIGLRAVGNNGKVYWSKGFAVNNKVSKQKIQTQVYSDERGREILYVAENRVPDIKYEFTPKYGNILYTPAGREFYGHIGGFIATAIDFQGLHAATYSIPRPYYSAKGKKSPAPVWEKQPDGQWALRFDGKSANFLALPNTAVPQRAGFMLTFDLKPDIIKPRQVIFSQEGVYWAGFRLSVVNGKFQIVFKRRTPHIKSSPKLSTATFKSNVPLLAGKWQKIVLKYDEKYLTISANGKSQSFPCEGIGLWLTISNFGGIGKIGNGKDALYQGLLRSLEIKHTAAAR
jgi:hypothetical protein